MFSKQTSLYHATMKQVVKFPQLFFLCTQCSKMEFFNRYWYRIKNFQGRRNSIISGEAPQVKEHASAANYKKLL